MTLNLDVLTEIVRFLEFKDIYRFKVTNHYFYKYIQLRNINMKNFSIDEHGLTSLDISNNVDYNHEKLSYGIYTQVKHLKLAYHSIFADQLVKLPNLTSLHVTPWMGTNFENLNNRGINSLTILTNLTELSLDFNIDIPIHQFTNLRTLSLLSDFTYNKLLLNSLPNLNIIYHKN